jgi:hypothetical protein
MMDAKLQEQIAKMDENSIPVQTVPVRGRFADERVHLVRPEWVTDRKAFNGCRDKHCWQCGGRVEFFYQIFFHYCYGVCGECGYRSHFSSY